MKSLRLIKKLFSKKMESNIEEKRVDKLIIDSHVHFQYFDYEKIMKIITKCEEANFKYYLSNSTTREDFDKTIELGREFPQIIPGIGHHPWYLEDLVNKDIWFDELVEYSNNLDKRGVRYFIGEIGIDGGRPKKYKNKF
jgi:Tat protein secretion system quality control protein TatD with DNase activity